MNAQTAPAASAGKTAIPRWEFIALAAALMSLNALAVDIMLPGLQQIGAALGEPIDDRITSADDRLGREPSSVVASLDKQGCTALAEQFGRVDARIVHRIEERGAPSCVGEVRIGPGTTQQVEHVRAVAIGSQHQRRLAFQVLPVRISSVGQQHFRDFRVAPQRGIVKC